MIRSPAIRHAARSLLAAGILAAALHAAPAASIPNTAGETLAGDPIVVADAVKGRRALLIVTFSKKAGDSARRWRSALQENHLLPPALACYTIAELEDTPRLFRGLIVSGIRKGTPASMHSTFVVLTRDTSDWKTFTGFTEDEPYVLLIGKDGTITLRVRGEPSAEKLQALSRASAHPE
jgi:hypothetical protein